jgi:hypothetical protein
VLRSNVSRAVYGKDQGNAPLDIEAENLDAVIVLPIDGLLPCVELLSFVDVLSARIAAPVTRLAARGDVFSVRTHIEKGAMRRTTCWEFFGPLRLGMRAGSKSGGKYLLRTIPEVRYEKLLLRYKDTDLYAQTWFLEKEREIEVVVVVRVKVPGLKPRHAFTTSLIIYY